MRRLLSLAVALSVASFSRGEVQIPPGYEVVEITDDPDNDYWARINNCGELVFTTGVQGDSFAEVFLYDNGAITQITHDAVSDAFPDINDDGTIVWNRHADGSGGGEVVRLRAGVLTVLGQGSVARINNLGHVAWYLVQGNGCGGGANAAIMFYDGWTVEQLTEGTYSDQVKSINDHDHIAWTQYDFCHSPWESEIMLWIDGVTMQLTNGPHQVQGPTINDRGQVAWSALGGIDFWEDGVMTRLTDWGRGPKMNNPGEILLHRWDDDQQASHLWWYRDGAFYQITNGPFSDTGYDINDNGEVVWRSHPVPNQRDIGMMRRVRNGDLDIDFDVDRGDFAAFPECMTGPVDSDRLCACRFFDIDHDRDVDLDDFALFQNLFTGEDS